LDSDEDTLTAVFDGATDPDAPGAPSSPPPDDLDVDSSDAEDVPMALPTAVDSKEWEAKEAAVAAAAAAAAKKKRRDARKAAAAAAAAADDGSESDVDIDDSFNPGVATARVAKPLAPMMMLMDSKAMETVAGSATATGAAAGAVAPAASASPSVAAVIDGSAGVDVGAGGDVEFDWDDPRSMTRDNSRSVYGPPSPRHGIRSVAAAKAAAKAASPKTGPMPAAPPPPIDLPAVPLVPTSPNGVRPTPTPTAAPPAVLVGAASAKPAVTRPASALSPRSALKNGGGSSNSGSGSPATATATPVAAHSSIHGNGTASAPSSGAFPVAKPQRPPPPPPSPSSSGDSAASAADPVPISSRPSVPGHRPKTRCEDCGLPSTLYCMTCRISRCASCESLVPAHNSPTPAAAAASSAAAGVRVSMGGQQHTRVPIRVTPSGASISFVSAWSNLSSANAAVGAALKCEECASRPAEWRCNRCLVNLCSRCDGTLHAASTPAMAQHSRVRLPSVSADAVAAQLSAEAAAAAVDVTTSPALGPAPAPASPAGPQPNGPARGMVGRSSLPLPSPSHGSAASSAPPPSASSGLGTNALRSGAAAAAATAAAPNSPLAGASSATPTVDEDPFDPLLMGENAGAGRRSRGVNVVVPSQKAGSKCDHCGRPALVHCMTCRSNLCTDDDALCHPAGTTAANHMRAPLPKYRTSDSRAGSGIGPSLLDRAKTSPLPYTGPSASAAAAPAPAPAAGAAAGKK
jgi:hypothetical protein